MRRELTEIVTKPRRYRRELQELLLAPPARDLDDLARAVRAFNGLFLGRACKRASPALVRKILGEFPPSFPRWTKKQQVPALRRNLIFLREAVPLDVDDETLLERWGGALQVLLDVQAYTWASKERRAKLAAVAAEPRFLQAIQAAVVGTNPGDDCMEFLSVLAHDGSDASVDALMPHLHHAMTTGEDLEDIERLRVHAAKTPAMQALLSRTEQLLDERSAASPATTLLRRLGVEVDECSFRLQVSSTRARRHVPFVQGSFSIETRGSPYFHLTIVRVTPSHSMTCFDDTRMVRDQLRLGRAELDAIPDFLARAGRKLRVAWNWDEAWVSSNLRGHKREAVVRWLRGLGG